MSSFEIVTVSQAPESQFFCREPAGAQLPANFLPIRRPYISRVQVFTLSQSQESQCFCRGPAGAQLPGNFLRTRRP